MAKKNSDADQAADSVTDPAAAAAADPGTGGADPAVEPDGDLAGPAESDDDLKARFRAALEHKRGHQSQAHVDSDGKASGLAGAHGPLGHKREFRRKSG